MTEPQTFQAYVARERERLTKQRDEIIAKRNALDEQLAEIDREMIAVTAYEDAKAGRVPSPGRSRRTPGQRRTGIREEIYDQLKKMGGATRAQIIEARGIKGNRSEEGAISNVLSALKKAGKLKKSNDGKYVAA